MSPNKDDRELYKKTMDEWGIQIQGIVFMEECAEATQAMSKVLRDIHVDRGYILHTNNLIEEIADVIIMAEQILHGYLLEVDDEALVKYNRLRKEKLDKVRKWLNG